MLTLGPSGRGGELGVWVLVSAPFLTAACTRRLAGTGGRWRLLGLPALPPQAGRLCRRGWLSPAPMSRCRLSRANVPGTRRSCLAYGVSSCLSSVCSRPLYGSSSCSGLWRLQLCVGSCLSLLLGPHRLRSRCRLRSCCRCELARMPLPGTALNVCLPSCWLRAFSWGSVHRHDHVTGFCILW